MYERSSVDYSAQSVVSDLIMYFNLLLKYNINLLFRSRVSQPCVVVMLWTFESVGAQYKGRRLSDLKYTVKA